MSGGASSWLGSVFRVLGPVSNLSPLLAVALPPFLPLSWLLPPFLAAPKEDLVPPAVFVGDLESSLVGDLLGEAGASDLVGEAGGEALVSSS